jgi:hypothetical protein
LLREIHEQLRWEQLKKDVVTELQPFSWRAAISRFAQHPAFLVLISFALTGLIGGWTTLRWQKGEWERQQIQLFKQHQAEQRYAIIDELFKTVGAHNGALRDAANKFYFSPDLSAAERDAVKKDLELNRKEWYSAVAIVGLKITAYFDDPGIKVEFDEFVGRHNSATYPMMASIFKDPQAEQVPKWVSNALKIADEETKKLQPLITLMKADAQRIDPRHAAGVTAMNSSQPPK